MNASIKSLGAASLEAVARVTSESPLRRINLRIKGGGFPPALIHLISPLTNTDSLSHSCQKLNQVWKKSILHVMHNISTL